MKKWIALLLTAVLVMSLAACSISFHINEPTAAPTDEPTEAVTDAPTQAPTEAPKAQAPAGYFYVEHPDGLWSVTVPEIWHETGMIINYDDAGTYYVKFVLKEAYYEGAGHVFTIATVTGSENFVNVDEFPHAEEMYRDSSMQVFAIFPTDVQFGVYDDPSSAAFKKQQEDYLALYDTRQAIIDSFVLPEN